MAEVTKVTYTGPNADGDPRVLSVTPDEAERLVKTGLYKKSVKKTTPTIVVAPEGFDATMKGANDA